MGDTYHLSVRADLRPEADGWFLDYLRRCAAGPWIDDPAFPEAGPDDWERGMLPATARFAPPHGVAVLAEVEGRPPCFRASSSDKGEGVGEQHVLLVGLAAHALDGVIGARWSDAGVSSATFAVAVSGHLFEVDAGPSSTYRGPSTDPPEVGPL